MTRRRASSIQPDSLFGLGSVIGVVVGMGLASTYSVWTLVMFALAVLGLVVLPYGYPRQLCTGVIIGSIALFVWPAIYWVIFLGSLTGNLFT